jgi:hypothetical protein
MEGSGMFLARGVRSGSLTSSSRSVICAKGEIGEECEGVTW